MKFSYIVTASGHGFHRFVARFNGYEFLSLKQIRFLTLCKMQDTEVFKREADAGRFTIIEISIKGETE
jgi:hypothetical protein